MIIGIGVDIIEIERVKKACQKYSFIRKIYTEREIELFGEKYSSLAGNFAVKEAVSKAFGTGVRNFKMTDIEVLRNEFGMPFVILRNGAKKISEEMSVSKIFVSISHNIEFAVGYAVAEGQGFLTNTSEAIFKDKGSDIL